MGLTTSSATETTTQPEYYTNYLTNLASQGKTAVDTARFADANANQLAAFQNVGANVGNYLPGLQTAGVTTGLAGGLNMATAANPYLTTAQNNLAQGVQGADQIVGNYMSPYMTNVMDSIRAANQQNIQQNLAPGLTAASVGAGQFGSQRGANALAMGISNADIGAAKEQSAALQSGYTQALAAAQKQRENQLAAGATGVQAGSAAANAAAQTAANYLNTGKQQASLAEQLQTAGLADTNALATLGAQQQAIAQNKADYPMKMLGLQAGLMSGQTIPSTVTKTSTGSTLGAIAGLSSIAAGLFTRNASGTAPWDNMSNTMKNWYRGQGIDPTKVTTDTTTGKIVYDDPNDFDSPTNYAYDPATGQYTVDATDDAATITDSAGDSNSDGSIGSDRRLKTDIEPVGRMDNGLTVYRYRYKAGGPVHIGVMADEVEKIRPDAYVKGGAGGGFDAVNYSKL